MKRSQKKTYAMCIENVGYPASLEKRKVYEVLPPETNDPDFMIRVVDESGEGYLFPAEWFVPIELTVKGRRAMAESV